MRLRLFPPALALAAIFNVQANDSLPRSPAQMLEQRSEMGTGVDMFARRAWTPPPPKKKLAAPAETFAPPSKPPALPFAYGGSGVVNGTPVLFLERRNESVMVRAGDVLGSYRVEAIQAGRAILRYLPLDIAQVLVFGSPGVVPAILQVPDEAPLGE